MNSYFVDVGNSIQAPQKQIMMGLALAAGVGDGAL